METAMTFKVPDTFGSVNPDDDQRERMLNQMIGILRHERSQSLVKEKVNVFDPTPYAIPPSEHSVLDYAVKGGTTFDIDAILSSFKDEATTVCVVTDGDSIADLAKIAEQFKGRKVVYRFDGLAAKKPE